MDLNAIGGVILAAGLSRRMGEAKLLLPWGKDTVLGSTLRQIKGAGLENLLLVSGAYRDEVEVLGSRLHIPVRHNPDFAVGEILSSLQVGVRHFLPGDAQVLLVFLGDLPLVQSQTLLQLVQAWEQERPLLAAPIYQGQQGHPTLLARPVWPELLALPAGARPRALFKKYAAEVLHVPVEDQGVVIDIDTPEAYARWRPQ